jgi:hypothetical protein
VCQVLRVADGSADFTRSFAALAAGTPRPLDDGDFQLALACCYEQHYLGFSDSALDEWDPHLLSLRACLEAHFEAALRSAVPTPTQDHLAMRIDDALRLIVADDDGPSLSGFILREATSDQVRDLLIQRSVYQLKEADPHTWGIPRLRGRAKAALVEIQHDEYGGGRAEAMHSALFAQALSEAGLDDTYGAYWDAALPQTLTAVNLMSYFGLHRRWRGALVGHLAALEMTSTAPMRRYANGLRRLGFHTGVTAYFDEHVEADAVHEQIASVDLAGSFVIDEPDRHADVLWGARACLAVDAAFAAALLDHWRLGAATTGAA